MDRCSRRSATFLGEWGLLVTLAPSGGGDPRHVLRVAREPDWCGLSIVERLRRVSHPPPKTSFFGRPTIELVSSGRLTLEVNPARGAGRSWSDGVGPLEDALGDVVLGVEDALDEHRKRREEDEARRLAEEAARARAAEEARRAEYRGALVKDLRDMAQRWEEARRVRAFLEAVEPALPVPDEQATTWLRWAREWAQGHDPLGQPASVPKLVTPWDRGADWFRAAEANAKKVTS